MKTTATIRKGTKIGAVLGGIAFLAGGLIPGAFFGSYGALVVMQRLMGSVLEPSVILRMVVAVGMILGVACMASVSIVAGSITGTALGYAAEALKAPATVSDAAHATAK